MSFPSCQLHFVPQRTPEWFDLRRGKLTASMFGPWLVKDDKTSDKARQTAICQCLAGIAGCEEPPGFDTWAMKRGIELEPFAVAEFERKSGLSVYPAGFAVHASDSAGCSPDGLIVGRNEGLECKCPVPATHVKYLLNGGLPDEYRHQVHGSMAVTGADAWHFCSYCPALPPLLLTVKRDAYTEALQAALWQFAGELETARSRMAAMWDREFKSANLTK